MELGPLGHLRSIRERSEAQTLRGRVVAKKSDSADELLGQINLREHKVKKLQHAAHPHSAWADPMPTAEATNLSPQPPHRRICDDGSVYEITDTFPRSSDDLCMRQVMPVQRTLSSKEFKNDLASSE
jgi:hypothetical protein